MSEAEPASLIANRYEVLSLLGAGGMGRVYRAHDRSLDETVALKMLRRELVDVPGALDRFRQEVKLARRVTSPHVVRTYDLGEHGDDHFLTMEYVDGHSLARRLADVRLPLDEVLRIARATGAGMSAAHAAGILHRDLKPDNVMVDRRGRVAITDFGLARPSQVTGPGDGIVGTPAYMAPEQVEGIASIGPSADVYAFGAMLFEMLTGVPPFRGTDAVAVATARLDRPPPDPRSTCDVPDALADLVLRCLAREPGARFADGAALVVALAAVADLRVTTGAVPKRVDVPASTSPAVAMLPLVAEEGLEEIAAGLSEEICDALTTTRELRIVPLATMRSLGTRDVREIGKRLDVDVVVDASLRRRGDGVRITTRVIGVADGFQLWASHLDSATDALLASGDDLARAIARAVTVDIALPARTTPQARAVELYLEGKAKVRPNWFSGNIREALDHLEPAAQLVPHDANVAATLATVLARASFLTTDVTELARACELAERAVRDAPMSGDGWFALGLARLYAGAAPDAAFAFSRAVVRAPGLALAQNLLGGLLLEAGALADAIAHLEAAQAIDPINGAVADLPRAYVYSDRWDDAFALLSRNVGPWGFALSQLARFRMWRGEVLPELDFGELNTVQSDFGTWARVVQEIHRTRSITRDQLDQLERMMVSGNARLKASRSQFTVEHLLFVGDTEQALAWLERAIAEGLQDHLWAVRCPILAPIRTHPRFVKAVAPLAQRASAILAAVQSARA